MKNKITLLILVLLGQISFAQTAGEKMIHGKIVVESGNGAGVSIVNLVNEKSATSDSNGDFFILAKADDLLIFNSVNLEYHRKMIEEDDMKQAVVIIKMIAKVTELEEVVINKYPKINAVDLGISPEGIIHRTQVERRLYTANSTPGDALLNYLSGRTAMIKKEIQAEKKLSYIQQIDNMFEKQYFINHYKIPEDYINGFKYYIVENEKFTAILNSKNKTHIELMMGELAIEYNVLISAEETKK